MLHPERIPLNEAEAAAVEQLTENNTNVSLHLTRQDPGETGPLIVQIGDVVQIVEEDGTVRNG